MMTYEKNEFPADEVPKSRGVLLNRRRKFQRGTSLIVAIYMATIASLFSVVGLTILLTSRSIIMSELRFRGQATNMALAGLADALSWFRRQEVQPVVDFEPEMDVANSIFDTEEPTVGLVREFAIDLDEKVYGRYELRKVEAAGQIRDVSSERKKSRDGIVWHLESEGLVYVKKDPDAAYDQDPNVVLKRIKLGSEIQRLSVVPPADAGICAARGDQVTLGYRGRIVAESHIGVAYPADTGEPTTSAGEIYASVNTQAVDPDFYNYDPEDVFGVSVPELRAMSDIFVTRVEDLPEDLPSLALIFIRGNAVFNASRPLTGGGILFVDGNLTIQSSSNSLFSGVVYTTGSFTQDSPSVISGTIISAGAVNVSGSGDIAQVDYDDTILNLIQQSLGLYRPSRNPYRLETIASY